MHFTLTNSNAVSSIKQLTFSAELRIYHSFRLNHFSKNKVVSKALMGVEFLINGSFKSGCYSNWKVMHFCLNNISYTWLFVDFSENTFYLYWNTYAYKCILRIFLTSFKNSPILPFLLGPYSAHCVLGYLKGKKKILTERLLMMYN